MLAPENSDCSGVCQNAATTKWLAYLGQGNDVGECVCAGGDADLASGAVGMAAAMEEEREAEQAARQGQQVRSHSGTECIL